MLKFLQAIFNPNSPKLPLLWRDIVDRNGVSCQEATVSLLGIPSDEIRSEISNYTLTIRAYFNVYVAALTITYQRGIGDYWNLMYYLDNGFDEEDYDYTCDGEGYGQIPLFLPGSTPARRELHILGRYPAFTDPQEIVKTVIPLAKEYLGF